MEVIRTSATTGDGVDDLLETILLTAEMNDYKANPDRRPSACAWKPSRRPAAA
jgi:translation initiation factor IF-2